MNLLMQMLGEIRLRTISAGASTSKVVNFAPNPRLGHGRGQNARSRAMMNSSTSVVVAKRGLKHGSGISIERASTQESTAQKFAP